MERLLVALLEVAGEVFDRAGHEAREDEVEVGVECPFVLEVVDEEVDVGWDA